MCRCITIIASQIYANFMHILPQPWFVYLENLMLNFNIRVSYSCRHFYLNSIHCMSGRDLQCSLAITLLFNGRPFFIAINFLSSLYLKLYAIYSLDISLTSYTATNLSGPKGGNVMRVYTITLFTDSSFFLVLLSLHLLWFGGNSKGT